MQDFSSMAQQMQNIASPGKMPMATMQGKGPIVGPPGPPVGAPPGPPQGPGGPPGPGGPGQDQMMQMIMQIAQQIELMTGKPATPEQIQAAMSQAMGGAGPGGDGGAPPGGAQPMVPPQTMMKR